MDEDIDDLLDGVDAELLDDELLELLGEGGAEEDLTLLQLEDEDILAGQEDPVPDPPPPKTTFTITTVEPQKYNPPEPKIQPKESIPVATVQSDSESDLEIIYTSTQTPTRTPVPPDPKPKESTESKVPKIKEPLPSTSTSTPVMIQIPKTEPRVIAEADKNPKPVPVPESTTSTSQSHKDKSKDKDRDKDKDKKKKSTSSSQHQHQHVDLSSTPESRLKTKLTRAPDFEKYKSKFNLLNTTCTVIEVSTIINLKKHMRLRSEKLERIAEIDRKSQIRWNSQNKRVRLINSFKPWTAPTKDKDSNRKKHGHHSHKDNNSNSKKKHKKVYIASDSDEENSSGEQDSGAGAGPPPCKKEKLDKDNATKSKSSTSATKDLYTSTGARILPFEKKHKELNKNLEQNRIRRPKMAPEPEPSSIPPSKRLKDRDFESNPTRNRALDKMLAAADAARANANNFKIPKKETVVPPPSSAKPRQNSPPPSTSTYQPPRANIFPNPPAGGSWGLGNQRFGKSTRLPYVNRPTDRFQSVRQDFNPAFRGGGRRPYLPPAYNSNNFTNAGDDDLDFNTPWHRTEGEQLPPEQPRPTTTQNLQSYGNRNRQPQLRPPPKQNVPSPDDMHDEPGSDNDEQTPPRTPPPPISEPILGYLAQRTAAYLERHKNQKIELPEQTNAEALTPDLVAKKIASWFRRSEKDFPTQLKDCPEDFDFIAKLPPAPVSDGMSEFGNVSNPDGDTDELTDADRKRHRDGDVIDEFAGAALLHAKYRIGSYEQETFQTIFELRPGSAYEKSNFQARCTICDSLLQSSRQLGSHVRSDLHRQNFKILFQKLVKEKDMERNRKSGSSSNEKATDRVPRDPTTLRLDKFIDKLASKKSDSLKSKASTTPSSSKLNYNGGDRAYSPTQSVENLSNISLPKSNHRNGGGGPVPSRRKSGRSRSRSRSRDRKNRERERERRRSRSRSRHRDRERRRSRSRDHRRNSPLPSTSKRDRDRSKRETSAEKVAKFLEKTNTYPTSSSKKHVTQNHVQVPNRPSAIKSIFPEILKLQAAGKWTDLLALTYQRLETEEKQIQIQMQEFRLSLKNKPESHPTYNSEWLVYWEKKYQEIEAEGKDPAKYDYVPGWKAFWDLRVEELVSQKHERLVTDLRTNYGFDDGSIQRLLSNSQSQQYQLQPTPPLPLVPNPMHQPLPPPPPSHSSSMEQHYIVPNPLHNPQMNLMDDMTARPMSLASYEGSLESGEVKSLSPPVPITPKPATLQNFSSIWENLTGQKIRLPGAPPVPPAAPHSNLSRVSSRVSSAGLSGVGVGPDAEIDVGKLLHALLELSDQLSILSSQVQSYYSKTQAQRLPNSSNLLLDQKDFCILLKQCRDRFLKLQLAGNQPSDTLKRINKVVYTLNELLGSERCSKFLEASAAPHAQKGIDDCDKNPTAPTPNQIQPSSSSSIPIPQPTFSIPPGLPLSLIPKVQEIQTTIQNIPLTGRVQIARILSSNLAALEFFNITDPELIDYVSEILSKAIGK